MKLLIENMGTRSEVARKLDVTPRAVRKWVNCVYAHPSNPHMQTILIFALELDRKRTAGILRQDLFMYRDLIRGFLKGVVRRADS